MKKIVHGFCMFLFLSAITSCGQNAVIIDKDFTALIVIGFICTVFFILARYSNLLRDEITDCEEFAANGQLVQQSKKWKLVNNHAPFSLTKVQFGLWTVIISSVYIYLSLFKGDCAAAPINKTALILMGIFAGSSIASSMIDKNEVNDNRPRHQNTPSQGLFIDILSDNNGISLHRFQNFAWTLIAITVYLYKVTEISTGCDLPELSDTLLALTGISNATFLVLRTNENNPAAQEVQKENSTSAGNPVANNVPARPTTTATE